MSRTPAHASTAHTLTAVTATFLIAAPLFAALLAAPAASAQQAITLETIGAVRMVTPDEVRGREAELATTARGVRRGTTLTGASPDAAR